MKKLCNLILVLLCAVAQGTMAQETLTVYDGMTTNSYVPVNAYYYNKCAKSQCVIPAADLMEMTGAQITGITFYTTSNNVPYNLTSTGIVYLKEVGSTSISAYESKEGATIVYTGTHSVVSDGNGGGTMTITFNTPYTYNGGNLLIGTENTTSDEGKQFVFYGKTVTGASISGKDDTSWDNASATQRNFLPKTTFTYTPVGAYVPKPTNLTCTLTPGDGSKVTLGWTENGTATAWKVAYKKASDADFTVVSVTDNPYTLSGLTPDVPYTVKVCAVSGTEQSYWSSSVAFEPTGKVIIGSGPSFVTVLPIYPASKNAVSQQIYTVSELGSAGEIQSVSYYSTVENSYARTIDIYMVSTTKSIFENARDWITVNASNKVFSGSVNFAYGWNAIEFDNAFTYDGVKNVAIIVVDNTDTYYSPASFLVFDATAQALSTANQYSTINLNTLSSTLGNLRNYKNQIRVGKVDPNVCESPATFAASPILAHSATLAWTGGSGTYNVEYKKDSDTEWTRVASGITDLSYVLTNLTAQTAYKVRVQSVGAGSVTSSWKAVSFTTSVTVPLTEDFATGELPDGWKRYQGKLNNDGTATLTTPASSDPWFIATQSGVFDIHAYSYISQTYTKYWLVTPNVAIEDNVQLSFDMALTGRNGDVQAAQTNGSDDRFVVLASTHGGSSWTILREWNNKTGSEYVLNNIACSATGENVEINLSSYAGQSIAVAFYVESTVNNANNYLHIDNVSIEYIPAVTKPTDLSYSELTATSAKLSWTENGTATAWQICLGNDETNLIAANINPFTITGLTAETTYTAKVRALGDSENSKWSAAISFTTLESVPKPTVLACTLTPGDGSKATLSWTENGTATAWQICLDDDETNLIAANTNPFTITGLTAETTYTAKVRAVGDGENSSWSDAVSFTPTNILALTVNDGTTTNDYVPIYGYYADEISMSQFIIPADNLAAIQQNTITKLTFYTYQTSVSWGSAKFEVYMAEVNNTAFTSGTLVWDGMTKVMNAGSLSVSSGQMVITLDVPFYYQGGNLMIGIKETTSGSYQTSSWYGITTTENTAIGNVHKSGSSYETKQFLPKITFEYLLGAVSTCAKPTDLALVGEPTKNTAQLSWTAGAEGQDAWQICVNGDEEHLIDVTETPSYTLTGLNPETEYTVKVRANCGGGDVSAWSNEITFTTLEQFPKPTDLAAVPTPTSAIVSWTGDNDATGYNVRYKKVDLTSMAIVTLKTDDFWDDGSGYQMLIDADHNTYGTTIPTDYPLTDSGDADASVYNQFEYKIPENADGALTTTNIVCGTSVTIVIPAGTYDWCITNPSPNDKMWIASDNGNIGGRANDYVFEAGKVYEFYVHESGTEDAVDVTITDAPNGGSGSSEWTVVNNVNDDSYAIDGLAANTFYQAGAQAIYDGGTSAWTTSLVFTTLIDNPVPFDVTVTAMPTSATIAWTGYSDSYQVKYRTAASINAVYTEGFENDLTGWTLKDCDDDTGLSYYAKHYGSQGFEFSFNSNPPQYLISPELTGLSDGMKLRFYYMNSSSTYTETFKVGYSPTTNDVSAFTFGDEISVSDDQWHLYSETIPAGTKYICCQYTSNDKYGLYIDDVAIGTEVAAGGWTTVSTNEATAEITGLSAGTDYDYQIIGIKDNTANEGTAIATFTTLYVITLSDNATDNSDVIDSNNGKACQVTLTDRKLWKDGYWNTICLPFDVEDSDDADGITFSGTPLAGAEARELTEATITGTTLNLTFSDPVDMLSAGTPYIIKWANDTEHPTIDDPVFNGVTIDRTPWNYDNGVDGDLRVRFLGNYDAMTIGTENRSILFLGTENSLYYPNGKEQTTIGACRAYFKIGDDTAQARQMTAFNINFGDETTGIKSIENGKWKIENDNWYGLDGRKLNGKPTRKGLYIHNGVKVVIK